MEHVQAKVTKGTRGAISIPRCGIMDLGPLTRESSDDEDSEEVDHSLLGLRLPSDDHSLRRTIETGGVMVLHWRWEAEERDINHHAAGLDKLPAQFRVCMHIVVV